MTDSINLGKSILNPVTKAATKTAISHVSMLSESVRDRGWRTKSHMNYAAKERLPFLILPLGFNTKSFPRGLRICAGHFSTW